MHKRQNVINYNSVMANNLFKSKASSLAKIEALHRIRHPGDLINEFMLPIAQQRKALTGSCSKVAISQSHTSLMKQVKSLRSKYAHSELPQKRKHFAQQQYLHWNSYLAQALQSQEYPFVTPLQRERIIAGVQMSKERHEERLALNRFNKWASQYSKAFKFDIPISALLLLKLVHPSYGYFRLLPSQPQFKLTPEQLITFINSIIVASEIRTKGWTLHSEQIMSLIMWNIFSNQGTMTLTQFCTNMEYFKFKVQGDNFRKVFQYSLKQRPMLENEVDVPFDLFRTIYLDRNL